MGSAATAAVAIAAAPGAAAPITKVFMWPGPRKHRILGPLRPQLLQSRRPPGRIRPYNARSNWQLDDLLTRLKSYYGGHLLGVWDGGRCPLVWINASRHVGPFTTSVTC